MLKRTVLLLAILTPSLAAPAFSHSWYERECCSGIDCAPVPVGAVKVASGGWLVVETNELIPFADKRVRQSQDSEFHVCRYSKYASAAKAGTVRCLYVPDGGV